MKSIYAKALKGALHDAFRKRLPQFEPFSVRIPKSDRPASTMQSGELVFLWRPSSAIWIFLSFIPHRSQERFTADVGWSTKQRFPWDIARPTVHSLEASMQEANLDECMIDFVDLLVQSTGSGVFFGWDVWKCSVEPEHPHFKRIFIAEDLKPVIEAESAKRTADAADRAIGELSTIAMRYLERLLKIKGSLR